MIKVCNESLFRLPWMGSALEALVRITKKALGSVTYDGPVYEESLITFLTEIESNLNSRGLTNVSNDRNNFNVITPNHFLIGIRNFNFPVLKPDVKKLRSHTGWNSVQPLTNMLWDRFLRGYLPTLNVQKK